MATEKTIPEKVRFRSYRTYNAEKFNEDLKQHLIKSDFNNLIENKELDKSMDLWTKTFKETAQKHAPIIEKLKKNKKENVAWFAKPL